MKLVWTLVIADILGHSDDRQIKETYGHILTKYRNNQLKNSRDYYKKSETDNLTN